MPMYKGYVQVFSRFDKIELVKMIEERCIGDDPEWEMVGKIKTIFKDGKSFSEPFDKRRSAKFMSNEIHKKYEVALRKIR
jgi:hypothetical protein